MLLVKTNLYLSQDVTPHNTDSVSDINKELQYRSECDRFRTIYEAYNHVHCNLFSLDVTSILKDDAIF